MINLTKDMMRSGWVFLAIGLVPAAMIILAYWAGWATLTDYYGIGATAVAVAMFGFSLMMTSAVVRKQHKENKKQIRSLERKIDRLTLKVDSLLTDGRQDHKSKR